MSLLDDLTETRQKTEYLTLRWLIVGLLDEDEDVRDKTVEALKKFAEMYKKWNDVDENKSDKEVEQDADQPDPYGGI